MVCGRTASSSLVRIGCFRVAFVNAFKHCFEFGSRALLQYYALFHCSSRSANAVRDVSGKSPVCAAGSRISPPVLFGSGLALSGFGLGTVSTAGSQGIAGSGGFTGKKKNTTRTRRFTNINVIIYVHDTNTAEPFPSYITISTV